MRKVEKKSTIVVRVHESVTRLPMCAVGSSSIRTSRKHPVANATKLKAYDNRNFQVCMPRVYGTSVSQRAFPLFSSYIPEGPASL
jgi:hypothetical protein